MTEGPAARPLPGGALALERTLVALAWESGAIRWRYPLAPRTRPAPVPGSSH